LAQAKTLARAVSQQLAMQRVRGGFRGLQAGQQQPPPVVPKMRLELCLEDDLPPGGAVLTEPFVADGDSLEGKSWGHWRSAGKLLFRPDGGVCGKFLDLCCDRDPQNLGHGHRSGWAASYQVFQEGGVVRIYDCKDLPPDQADLSELPLLRKEVGGCRLSQKFIGSGSEVERLKAAREIARTRYSSSVFDQHGLTNGGLWELASSPTEPIRKKILTVSHARNGDICKVTCTGLSGDAVCVLDMPQAALLAEFRRKALEHIGSAVFLTPDGKVLKRSHDDLSLKDVFEQCANKVPRVAEPHDAADQASAGK